MTCRLKGGPLAAFLLLDELLQKLVCKGLVWDLGAHLRRLPAAGRGDRQDLAVHRVGPRVGSPIELDVDRVARHVKALLTAMMDAQTQHDKPSKALAGRYRGE